MLTAIRLCTAMGTGWASIRGRADCVSPMLAAVAGPLAASFVFVPSAVLRSQRETNPNAACMRGTGRLTFMALTGVVLVLSGALVASIGGAAGIRRVCVEITAALVAARDHLYADVQRRLAAGLKDSAVHIALTARPDPALASADVFAGPTAFLLLESAAGTRRVGIGERPGSIGSAGKCDLVLPEREGIAPEHVLVWRHGTQIVLHAALDATCHVNDSAVTWALLDEGDVVRVGDHVLKVSLAT